MHRLDFNLFGKPSGEPSGGGGASQFVRIEFRGGVLSVRPVGPSINQREAPIIAREALEELKRHGRGVRTVVMDLSDVKAICSMGLGMCIDIRNQAAALKAKSVLYGLSDEIRDLVRLMRIERLYTIARTPAELKKLAA